MMSNSRFQKFDIFQRDKSKFKIEELSFNKNKKI